jgi:glycosidase
MEWEESRWNLRIFDTVRKLIALRHEHPALRRGSFELLLAFNRVLAFSRRLGDDEVLVILNPGHPRRDFSVRLTSASTAPFIDALTGALYPVGSSQIVVPELAGRSSLVLTRSADNAR